MSASKPSASVLSAYIRSPEEPAPVPRPVTTPAPDPKEDPAVGIPAYLVQDGPAVIAKLKERAADALTQADQKRALAPNTMALNLFLCVNLAERYPFLEKTWQAFSDFVTTIDEESTKRVPEESSTIVVKVFNEAMGREPGATVVMDDFLRVPQMRLIWEHFMVLKEWNIESIEPKINSEQAATLIAALAARYEDIELVKPDYINQLVGFGIMKLIHRQLGALDKDPMLLRRGEWIAYSCLGLTTNMSTVGVASHNLVELVHIFAGMAHKVK